MVEKMLYIYVFIILYNVDIKTTSDASVARRVKTTMPSRRGVLELEQLYPGALPIDSRTGALNAPWTYHAM